MVKRFVAMVFVIAAAAVQGETFQAEGQFTITLPDDWVEIPEPALDHYVRSIEEQSSGEPTQYYDYGYQMTSSTWMSYPYILVEVLPYGRLPSGALKRMAVSEEGEGQVLDEQLNAIFSGVTNGERTYDRDQQMLWTTLAIEKSGGEQIKALVGVKLTEIGLIRLTGCAPADVYEQHVATFYDAFATLEVDEAIRYKPQLTDQSPVVGHINVFRIMLWVVEGIAVGGVLWLIKAGIVRMIRSRKAAAE